MSHEHVLEYPNLVEPTEFTIGAVSWVPWLEPVPEAELTERQEAALDAQRRKFPYFRLLARDPEILTARTKTDNDIFYNVEGGLPRAERELAAAATSRFNGCVFCASVHARFAVQLSENEDAVQRLMTEGVDVSLDNPVWDAIVEASIALTKTPSEFSREHVEKLRALGLDDASIIDVINGAAFFNWANRLMLSIGAAELPKSARKAKA